LFQRLDPQQQFISFFPGIPGGDDFDVEGIHPVVQLGKRLVDGFCFFVEVVLNITKDFISDILISA